MTLVLLAALIVPQEDLAAARGHFEKKEYTEALSALDPILKEDPAHRKARALEFQCCHALKDYARIVEALKALKEAKVDVFRDPQVRKALADVVNAVAQSGGVEHRITLFEGLTDTFPNLPWTGLYRAMAVAMASRDGKSEKAVKTMERLDDRYAKQLKGAKPAEKEKFAAEFSENRAYLAYVYWRAGLDEHRLSREEAEPKATFEDVTRKRFGETKVGGRRVAVADYDGDGYEDILVGGKVYHNDRGKGFTPLDVAVHGTALWGDMDNDGDPDIVSLGQTGSKILENKGKGEFEQAVTLPDFPGPPEGNALVDIDGDGRLDLYVAVYEQPFMKGHPDHLFINQGDFNFEERGDVSGPELCGRGVACADFDNDGDQDIFVADYRLQRNLLWRNDGDGALEDAAEQLGVQGTLQRGAYGHGIGAVWGDLDNDGDLDLVVANLAHPRFIEFSDKTHVYFNLGKEKGWTFADRFSESGIRYEETHSDPALVDFDNDGDLDLYLTSVYKERPSHVYQNDGTGRFEPISWKSGAIAFNGWGQAWFDYDRDGDLDLIVCATGVRLLENQLYTGARKHGDPAYIRLKLIGKKSNTEGIGARVKVTAGDRVQIRDVHAGRGTTSQDSSIVHVGLGDHDGTVSVEVRWPGGKVYRHPRLTINRLHKVRE